MYKVSVRFLQKTEHYEAPFLFSQRNIQAETCFWSLFVCSFKFWIITYIQADTEKGPFSSNCSFSVSPHMYLTLLVFCSPINVWTKTMIKQGSPFLLRCLTE